MKKIFFNSEKAIRGIAPFSTLTEYNGTIYLSGVTATDPQTNQLAGDIEEQTVRALEILRDILVDYGISMQNVLKVTLYLDDMKKFPKINSIYEKYFSEPYPARTCVQISKLPLNAQIEIDVIACR